MRKFFKNNWLYLLGVGMVLLLFSLRFYHLTILPIFADEAIYIRWAQVMRAEETLRFLPLSDGKEPLFMWAVIPFLKIFSDPLVAGRVVSVLSGLATMIGTSFLSYLLFKNKKVALMAALIYAVSPFTFFFDRMALVDSMLTMFGVWTFIFSFLAVRNKRFDFAMLAGFSLGGAWLTKSSALFFALMLPVFLLVAPWKRKTKENFPILVKSIGLLLATAVIGYGFFNILRLGPNFHLISSRNMDYVYPISHIFTSPFDPFRVFIEASARWISAMGPWPLYLLAVAGILVNFKKRWKEIVIVAIWLLLPIIVNSEFAKSFTARYILYNVPYLMVLAASVFTAKLSRIKSILLYLVLAVFVFLSIRFDYYLLFNPYKADLPRSERSGYLEEWTAGQGIAETAKYLIEEQAASPNEKIVVGTEGYFGTLPDGLQIYLQKYPQITAIGVGLRFDNIPSPLMGSKAYGDKTYLLVNASRFSGNAQYLGLKLVKEFPKAEKPNGTHDSLLLFEVTNEALKVKANFTDL